MMRANPASRHAEEKSRREKEIIALLKLSYPEDAMPSKRQIIFLAAILLTSCAAPTPPATATAFPTSTHMPIQTSTPTPIPTSTYTPEPALPSYGVIDPNIGEKLKAEGIVIPDELKNPEYKLDLATELQKTNWGNAYGIDIPITVIPEKGIAYGKYHIKGIGATQEAWNAYAEQHIKYMWIHYREYGNPADRNITLEQYVELLKQGRGGFKIPQYNPETGFFDKKAMVNPLSGYVKVIGDNEELPLKRSTENSYLFYVDSNGMVWSAGNDLEFIIEQLMSPDIKYFKEKPYTRSSNLANALINGPNVIGFSSNQCLATNNASAACVRDGAKIEAKYREQRARIWQLYDEWLAKYEAGDHNAQPPMWIDD